MTISSQHNKHVYVGNGLTDSWAYTFPIINASDIEVWLTDSQGVVTLINSNYTVNTNLNTVTYPTVISGLPKLTAQEKITLRRKIPLTQDVDLDNQGPLPSTTLENEYDKLTLITQQHAEELSRCVKLPIDETPTDQDVSSFLLEMNNLLDDAAAEADAAAQSAIDALNSANDSAASAAAALISEQNAAQSYQDCLDAIQNFVDHFYDKHEVPTGIVDGVNTDFDVSMVPINGIVKVFRDGLFVPLDQFSFNFPTVTLNTPPSIGQKIEVLYITNGMVANPSVPGASFNVEYHTVTPGELAAKQFALSQTPLAPTLVMLFMIGGSPQIYGTDFTISGATLDWNGLLLDGQVLVGTQFLIIYFY